MTITQPYAPALDEQEIHTLVRLGHTRSVALRFAGDNVTMTARVALDLLDELREDSDLAARITQRLRELLA